MASEKIVAIVDEVAALSVLELAELVKEVEDRFGVSAAAAVAEECAERVGKRKIRGTRHEGNEHHGLHGKRQHNEQDEVRVEVPDCGECRRSSRGGLSVVAGKMR